MSLPDFRRRADVVREVPLETVLIRRGAVRDRRDRSKWRTERGVLSVTGCKFINWQQGAAGGGAIDLVMHLAGMDCGAAVQWLEQHVAGTHPSLMGAAIHSPRGTTVPANGTRRPLRLPPRDDRKLDRVRAYLTQRRHLSALLVESLLQCGRLYADGRGNAVFLLVAGKASRPVGAELRGTGPRIWRGMAPGTCKDSGYFWIGQGGSPTIVLCESAIDAVSCYQLDGGCICISTSGVRSNPGWLRGLIARGYKIYCGFDADEAGDTAAAAMLRMHGSVHRLRPPAHDWNDALLAKS